MKKILYLSFIAILVIFLFGCESLGTTSGEKVEKYVDLGLSVKWATCNLGAESPGEFGDYFAWGETKPKEIYDWSTYKYCEGRENTLTKYCCHTENGKVDDKIVLELADDAAYVNLGKKWRIPTAEEWTELMENCVVIPFVYEGVQGIKLKSKINSNEIFIPCAGCKYGEEYDFDYDSPYMTSNLNLEDDEVQACYKSLSYVVCYCSYEDGEMEFDGCGGRYVGIVIRPVRP